MAHLPHGRHGYFPQRRAAPLPWVTKCSVQLIPSETGSNPASAAEQLCTAELCETRADSPSAEKLQPATDVAALFKRIRIHPEARRILGNCSVPVVSLERLSVQAGFLSSSLQPVVSLAQPPCQTPAELSGHAPHLDQQNGFSQAAPSDPDPAPVSCTEPYCPDTSSSEEPEQDSGFDCDSDPDQQYILVDSGSDQWDPEGRSETFYLDPDPEQTLVIELDPEPVGGQEVEAEPGPGAEEVESEDFCAVCLNGGELLCCDRCPKVYHLACHIPALAIFPRGDWVCSLCRSDQEPEDPDNCENLHSCGGVQAPYILSTQDQRRCEKLTLLLYCHTLSTPFHDPVSPLARNYYQIIKRPINLSAIRRKLDKNNTLHYFTAAQFVDDVLLMFKNCATFNYPDSEVAQAGQNLELFFLSQLKEIFPDRTFPSARQDTSDRAQPHWLGRKRKENYRKNRYAFRGQKYYL